MRDAKRTVRVRTRGSVRVDRGRDNLLERFCDVAMKLGPRVFAAHISNRTDAEDAFADWLGTMIAKGWYERFDPAKGVLAQFVYRTATLGSIAAYHQINARVRLAARVALRNSPPATVEPCDVLIPREEIEVAERCIASLPERQQLALSLSVRSGSKKLASRALDTTPGRVRASVQSARKLLRADARG